MQQFTLLENSCRSHLWAVNRRVSCIFMMSVERNTLIKLFHVFLSITSSLVISNLDFEIRPNYHLRSRILSLMTEFENPVQGLTWH